MSILVCRQWVAGEREVCLSGSHAIPWKNAPSGVIIRNTTPPPSHTILFIAADTSHVGVHLCGNLTLQTGWRVCLLWVTHRPSLCRCNTNLGWNALLLLWCTFIHKVLCAHWGTFIHRVLLHTELLLYTKYFCTLRYFYTQSTFVHWCNFIHHVILNTKYFRTLKYTNTSLQKGETKHTILHTEVVVL